MAVLGMETSSGDFEVVDLCFAGLPELYRPPSEAPYLNGKGKAKEKEEAMEVDGTAGRSMLKNFGLMIQAK